jgi:hypothetical protein
LEKKANFKTAANYFIFVGSEDAWQVALKEGQWGFKETTKGYWNTIKNGDLVAFYVTSPIKKVIGFGRIRNKFVDEKLIWPDEKLFKRSIWKCKVTFEKLAVCNEWANGIEAPSNMILIQGRKTIDKDLFLSLVKAGDSKWNTEIYYCLSSNPIK